MNHVLYVVVLTRVHKMPPLIYWSQPLQTSKVGLNITTTLYVLLQIVVWADCLSYLASAAEKPMRHGKTGPLRRCAAYF
jgi:hypothetical protein